MCSLVCPSFPALLRKVWARPNRLWKGLAKSCENIRCNATPNRPKPDRSLKKRTANPRPTGHILQEVARRRPQQEAASRAARGAGRTVDGREQRAGLITCRALKTKHEDINAWERKKRKEKKRKRLRDYVNWRSSRPHTKTTSDRKRDLPDYNNVLRSCARVPAGCQISWVVQREKGGKEDLTLASQQVKARSSVLMGRRSRYWHDTITTTDVAIRSRDQPTII